MKLLNTFGLTNVLLAHSANHIASYADGVVKHYRKDNARLTLTLLFTYTVADVKEMRLSDSGAWLAIQTETALYKANAGALSSVGAFTQEFGISDSGTVIHLNVPGLQVQVITSTITNIAASGIGVDDRVSCGVSKYLIYNSTRSYTALYTDVTFTPVTSPSGVTILFAYHVQTDLFAFFYSDGTATYNGVTRSFTSDSPRKGFKSLGRHIRFTDYKKEYVVPSISPISDANFVRNFGFLPPPMLSAINWRKQIMLVSGDTTDPATVEKRYFLTAEELPGVTVVADSPYGNMGKSFSFDGTTSVLRIADSAQMQIGAADFTIEAFVRIPSGWTGIPVICSKGGDGVTIASYQLQANVTASLRQFQFIGSTNGTAVNVGTTDGTTATVISWGNIEYDVWTHVAVARSGKNIRFFQDGILQYTFVMAADTDGFIPLSGRGMTIGGRRATWGSGALQRPFKGLLHGFRMTNYARYTSNFVVDTIPGESLPAVVPSDITPYVWTLLDFSGSVPIDAVSGAPLLMGSGSSLSGGKLVTASAGSSTEAVNKIPAVYFDANEDFSIEGWFNFSSIDSYAGTIISQDVSGTGGSTNRSYMFGLSQSASPYFLLSADGSGTGLINLSTPVVSLNADHHMAVCRVDGVLNIYVDGVSIYKASNNTASFKSTEFQFIRRGAVGSRWGIRVCRGMSAYTKNFTPPTSLPALTTTLYAADVLADIVLQACFRNNVNINEANNTDVFTLAGTAAIAYGRMTTTAANSSRFSIPCGYFGAADFTIEFTVRLPVAPSASDSAILGQYLVSTKTGNSWQVSLNTDGTLRLYMFKQSTNGQGGGSALITSSGKLKINTDCHVVIERVGTLVTMYIDGVSVGNTTIDGAIFDASATIPVRNFWESTASANTLQVTNIRIAKRAMYNGKIPYVATYPKIVFQIVLSPGPQSLKYGTRQLGYYGQVTSADMLNGANLPSLAGLASAGTAINASTIWLKFAYQNKIVYIPKQPLLSGVKWDDIYAAGAVFGTDDVGYAPASTTVNQKKVVTVNSSKYVVRLPQGSDAEVSTSTAYYTQNPSGVQNSEWNNLMGRVWESDPTATYWEKFTATEMGTVIGAYNSGAWGQESLSANSAQRVMRDHPPLLGYTGGVTANSVQSANLQGVWWPVLEWQNSVAPDLNLINGTTLPAGTTVNGNAAVTSNKVTIPANSYLTIPNNAALALGTADFEITVEFTIKGSVPNSYGSMATFLFWGTYAQPSQPYNIDFYYDLGSGYVFLGGNTCFDTTYSRSFLCNFVTGKAYKLSLVRENGVLYCYVNGRQVGSSAFAVDLPYSSKGAANLSVGRRRGGASNDVYWDSNIEIRSLVIRK